MCKGDNTSHAFFYYYYYYSTGPRNLPLDLPIRGLLLEYGSIYLFMQRDIFSCSGSARKAFFVHYMYMTLHVLKRRIKLHQT